VRRLALVVLLAGCTPGLQEERAERDALEAALAGPGSGGGDVAAPSSRASADARELEADASVERVVAAALARNPDVAAAFERHVAALERPAQVDGLPDPIARYRWSSMFRMHVAELMQDVPFPTKLLADGRAALAEAKALRLDATEAALRLAAQAAAAHTALGLARAEQRLVVEAAALADRAVEAARSRVAAGTARAPDVLRAEVEQADLTVEQLAAERDVTLAVVALNALLDRRPDAPFGPTGPLAPPPGLETGPGELTALFEAALARRPTLAAAAARVESAEAGVDRADQAWLPDLTFGAGYVRDDAESEDEVEATAGLSLPIWIGRLRAGQREAAARRRAADEEARAAKARVLEEVARAAARRSAARAQRVVLESTAAPRARQAVEASAAAYASGELDLLGLLDAQRLALRIARDLERARAEEALAAIELSRASGTGLFSQDFGGAGKGGR
jgi:cobalt-zinc-cadmium efflux system outer membrane protein